MYHIPVFDLLQGLESMFFRLPEASFMNICRYADGEGNLNTFSSKESSQELNPGGGSQELEDEFLVARQQVEDHFYIY